MICIDARDSLSILIALNKDVGYALAYGDVGSYGVAQNFNPSRRQFIVGTSSLGTLSLTGCVTPVAPIRNFCGGFDSHFDCPIVTITVPAARLYINVFGENLDLYRSISGYCLRHVDDSRDAKIAFELAAQHFAETSISLSDVYNNSDNPSQPPVWKLEVLEEKLQTIDLYPSASSRLVYNVPKDYGDIFLELKDILDWSGFTPIFPSLAELAEQTQGSTPKYTGHAWNSRDMRFTTSVELPWGIYLQPPDYFTDNVEWRHPARFPEHEWQELWYTSLENKSGRERKVPLEFLDVSGFTETVSANEINYTSTEPAGVGDTTLIAENRLKLIASLSERFPYDPEFKLKLNSSLISRACYLPGNSLSANRLGLSSLGGMLDVKGEWFPEAPCALQAWTHTAHLGRDTFVKVEEKGWLYPLGVPAVLIVQSERRYIKDKTGHFVAPLVKTAFVLIPQPNEIEIEHGETPFTKISVTTRKTPPLDVPVGHAPETYQSFAYFMPTVDSAPFEFEITCTDWVGESSTSRISCYFVHQQSATIENLICEPDYGLCDLTDTSNPFAGSVDAALGFSSEGLWDLDARWASQTHRFARFNGQQIAVNQSDSSGDTNHEVEWVEFVRSAQPEKKAWESSSVPDTPKAITPFIPRVRTLKLALQNTREFSGESSFVIGTYRDLRNECAFALDPKPVGNEVYFANVLNPNAANNQPGAYLQIIPLPGHDGTASATWDNSTRKTQRNDSQRLAKIMDRFYHKAPLSQLSMLLQDLDNEVRFGVANNTEQLGGLVSPNAYANLLTRIYGPVGEATFDPHSISLGGPSAAQVIADCSYT